MNQLLSTPPVKTSPDSDLATVLTAWDRAHPAATNPDWRHLLDEMAHPHTTRAFHSLATTSPA
ncbi:hypothetical protein ABK046_00610 [Streptomyces caeruleatus]